MQLLAKGRPSIPTAILISERLDNAYLKIPDVNPKWEYCPGSILRIFIVFELGVFKTQLGR